MEENWIGADKFKGFLFVQQVGSHLSKVTFEVIRGPEPFSMQAVANVGCTHHSSLANVATKSPSQEIIVISMPLGAGELRRQGCEDPLAFQALSDYSSRIYTHYRYICYW